MRQTTRDLRTYPKMIYVAWLFLAFSGLLYGQVRTKDANALPDGPGKDLMAVACSQCHDLQTFLRLRDGREGWRERVNRMILRGAQLLPEQADAVVAYLSRNFGPGMSPMQTIALPPKRALVQRTGSGPSETVALPAGDGRDLVQSHCKTCHDLGRVVSARRTKAEWDVVVKNMIASGSQATPDQIQTMVSYLIANFGSDTN